MKMMGEYLVEMLSWLEEKKGHQICIVECGTIRNPSFDGHEDGLSTYHIAKWIRDQAKWRHKFHSLDASPGCIEGSQSFLETYKLDEFVDYGLGDAGTILRHFNKPLDFCYLDAGEDFIQNLAQFRYAQKWMDLPGFVVIDDVFEPRNTDRGLVTVPFAKLEGYRVASIADRMAVIAFGTEAKEFIEGWSGAKCV